MKKYLSFALAAALSAAFCATAFAAEDNRQVKVETHIAPNVQRDDSGRYKGDF